MRGKYFDAEGKKQELPSILFTNLMMMRVGEKDMIEDSEAGNVWYAHIWRPLADKLTIGKCGQT